jgi:hypothetical protein
VDVLTHALVALLAADGDPPPEHRRRWTGAVHFTSVLPYDNGWPATAGFDVGFEPIPQLRIFILNTLVYRDRGVPAGPIPRYLVGLELIATPLLPVELAGGVAFGLTAGGVTDIFPPGYTPGFTSQLRIYLGYRFLEWLGAGFLASGNATLAPTVTRPWAELGARLVFRW